MNEFAYWNENYEYQPSTTRTAVLMLAKLCQNGTCFLTFAGGLARKQNFRGCTLGNSESFKGWNFFCYVLDMCGVLSNHSSPCKPPSQDLFVPVWPQWRKHTEFVFFWGILISCFSTIKFPQHCPCHDTRWSATMPLQQFHCGLTTVEVSDQTKDRSDRHDHFCSSCRVAIQPQWKKSWGMI